jgi:energy-coupling factor transport system ATP-binding protein
VIRFEQVPFTYPGAAAPTPADLDLVVPEGELCLVIGPTGSGKSTLLQAVNGLVPRFTGGLLTGSVLVDGRRTEDHPPRELADLVGVVGQDPAAGFVTDTVEDELAYVMENLGIAPDAMRRRVEDVLDLLGLHELRRRPLGTLSGGQQQRVAIGSVLTAAPRVLVLDEPTSALDPAAAEEVLAALTRLVHDLGIRSWWPSTASAGGAVRRYASCSPGSSQALLVGSRGRPRHVQRGAPVVALGRPAGRRCAVGATPGTSTPCATTGGLAPQRSPPAQDDRGDGGRRGAAYGPVDALLCRSTCGAARSSRSWAATARASPRC